MSSSNSSVSVPSHIHTHGGHAHQQRQPAAVVSWRNLPTWHTVASSRTGTTPPPSSSYVVDKELNNKVSVWRGDITKLDIGAIVNAANLPLAGCGMPGHCIDAAIHIAAGARLLLAATRPFGGCATGDAVITPGFALPAQYIIHTVGPQIRGEDIPDDAPDGWGEDPVLLARCYTRSLELCLDRGIRTIAFCCISTGIFGYRKEAAAHVALKTVRDWLNEPYTSSAASVAAASSSGSKEEDKKASPAISAATVRAPTESSPASPAVASSVASSAAPPSVAASVAAATGRRSDAFDLVLFDTFTMDDTIIYQQLLPRYFPTA